MANKKISELTLGSTPTGAELLELVQSGVNVKSTVQTIGVTHEINRTWTDALLFDKNEITYEAHTMDADIAYSVAAGSNLVDQFSCARQRIVADGVHAITFSTDFNFIYGITNGQILDAGTYQIYFLYLNGNVTVNFPGITAESSSIIQLSTPTNFAAVPGAGDPETEVDLTWTDVSNESNYEIQYSSTGGSGPWLPLTEPAANATSYTHTGLTPGTTYHYRIRAIGDGVSFSDSAFATDATTTESSGDVTAPTFTFSPASGNTVWPVNKVITITANEAIRNTDGSEITNANVATRLTLKETNSGGANIAFTATIDVSKTIITITPTTVYGDNQLVYVAINNVEDVNGNEVTVAVSSTFTTTEHTLFDGSSNRLIFGDILDSLFTADNTNFWLELTINEMLLTGTRPFVSKWDTAGNQRSFQFYSVGTDVYFGWTGNGSGSQNRFVKWANALTAGEHILVLKYDGSIDTNNGLDRVTLLIDGGTAGSKTMENTGGASIPNINNSTAQLAVGAYVASAGTPGISFYSGEAKDFIIRSTAGSVVEINVPTLRDGTDTSGNARNGTWV